jgi:hypothetical protein
MIKSVNQFIEQKSIKAQSFDELSPF